ncbi:hypothetical protein SLEP1_g3781 [Rubroshorea leprosula]|uniref:Uncharacterized protein n=1 Tax=Rubroshorea leprosula TaxID=152421 RepID=A0AAV5HUS6_9ROSI|nr:hypothetical protein SLEP1_g3781 [Rubroshorea leprosula]
MCSQQETILRTFYLSSAMPVHAASSSEIRDALKDEHLQKLICDIDKSPDPINELDKAMGTDVFCIFTNKILSAIKP